MPPAARRRRPRRTVRRRLTVLYALLFAASGLVLLLIANGVAAVSQAVTAPVHVQGGLAPQPVPRSGPVAGQYLLGSAIALAVMTAGAAGLGWFIAGRALAPLRVMTATTRRISEDSLHERLAMTGPGDELTELAATIDGLLERLEHAFAAQRRFVANASHELRTPLTTMRAAVDVALAKPQGAPPATVALAGRLRGELDRTDALLDGLLVLARAQHAGPAPAADGGPLALDGAVTAALAARAADIAAAGLAVTWSPGPDGPWVAGHHALLRRMVGNVIDNAVGHNEPGGWITVATATAAADEGPVARLVVETGGAVLDPGQVEQLGQPFRRLRADRTGSDGGAGLGLSIVAAIVAAHGGTLDLAARAQGGLAVSIGLPRAGAP
jgi:signal transduction histidine kinase